MARNSLPFDRERVRVAVFCEQLQPAFVGMSRNCSPRPSLLGQRKNQAEPVVELISKTAYETANGDSSRGLDKGQDTNPASRSYSGISVMAGYMSRLDAYL